MPALQSLTITDREATPVTHTFNPLDIQNGLGTVVESTGVPLGNASVTVGLRKTTGKYKKALLNMTVPIVQTETINGVSRPVVVRTGYVKAEFQFDESSTEQERTNLVGMFANALATNKPLVNDCIVKLQGVY